MITPEVPSLSGQVAALANRLRTQELRPTGGGGGGGEPGPPGPTGPAGPTGPQGIPGPTGPQGPTGNTGSQGPKGDTGATGSTGPQGNPGATGSQGPQGIQGVQGPTGSTGSPGSPGAAGEKWFSGTGVPAGGTGAVGDWYLNDGNGDVYEKTGASAWTLRDNLTGPQGTQGIQGIQGVQGPTGSTGSAGTPGEKWFSGTGVPAGGTGIIGDWYLNDANGDVYEKTGASAWTLRDNLTGPQGTQGIQGIQGPTGSTGTSGGKWFSGAGAPATGTGTVGDWYLNTVNGDVHEKTGAAVWTLRDNLTGPQGATGQAEGWLSGAGAPAGATGNVGDWYLNTTTSDVHEKTGASAWTLRTNIKGAQGIQGPAGPVASGLPYLFLNLLNDVPAVAGTVYQFKGKVFDTHSGWDAVNYRYTIPISGIYLIHCKVQADPGNNGQYPAIQTAPTAGGTYTTQVQSEVPAPTYYGGNKITAILKLTAGNGLRAVELASNGWAADTVAGANYLQLTLLSQ
jgi:Collagen triple helix repeat (20 copies)